jgi:hypothetical protein
MRMPRPLKRRYGWCSDNPGISSQMIDNINASIHVRALLTDVFIIDEVIKSSKA